MTSNHRIEQLISRLQELSEKQQRFNEEITALREELQQLKTPEEDPFPEYLITEDVESEAEPVNFSQNYRTETVQKTAPEPQRKQPPETPASRSNLERFIGENLINKIGIVITVIGVAIGARYAIENELISPLTRIILGYLAGLGLLGFAIRLRKDYDNFSAVLLSGSMAILYFITYAAYSLYGLFPQIFAFILMVAFTAFTVLAAIKYNRAVIAHIGLIGAYAVPFLLSQGSGQVGILFTYMAIINIGILAIAFRRYWKSLFIASFALTSLIYLGWYFSAYNQGQHFSLALIFLFVNFVTFYFTVLSYKLIRKEQFAAPDIMLLLSNAFIFFGIGYSILADHPQGKYLLGLFSLANACIHLIACIPVYRDKMADRNLFFLIIGLVILFITITIPIELSGRWVTLLWAGEAALLFWIGRTKKVTFYEGLSGIMIVLATVSLFEDWASIYNSNLSYYADSIPLFNDRFMLSALFITALGFMNYTYLRNPSAKTENKWAGYVLPAILLIILYFAGMLELKAYWNAEINRSYVKPDINHVLTDPDIERFKKIWLINYALLFSLVLSFINTRWIKNNMLGMIAFMSVILSAIAFLSGVLPQLHALVNSYLTQNLADYFPRESPHLLLRYISLSFFVLALITCQRYAHGLSKDIKKTVELSLHICIIWIASSELLTWLDMARADNHSTYSLSILWGAYALFLIVLGIRQKKSHLRIAAIVLFGITLCKLFFVDIAHLRTLAKTIVFIALGILLLIISFLYNKYKHLIAEHDE